MNPGTFSWLPIGYWDIMVSFLVNSQVVILMCDCQVLYKLQSKYPWWRLWLKCWSNKVTKQVLSVPGFFFSFFHFYWNFQSVSTSIRCTFALCSKQNTKLTLTTARGEYVTASPWLHFRCKIIFWSLEIEQFSCRGGMQALHAPLSYLAILF